MYEKSYTRALRTGLKKTNNVSVLDSNIPTMRESHINVDNVSKMLIVCIVVPGTTAS